MHVEFREKKSYIRNKEKMKYDHLTNRTKWVSYSTEVKIKNNYAGLKGWDPR